MSKYALQSDPELVTKVNGGNFNQEYCVVSFVSPRDEIKDRFMFEANKFLVSNVNTQLIDYCNNVCTQIWNDFKGKLDVEHQKYNTLANESNPAFKMTADILSEVKNTLQFDDTKYKDYIRSYKFDPEDLKYSFELFKGQHNSELASEYKTNYTEATSIHGLKVRGVYQTLEEARERAMFCTSQLEPAISSGIMPIGKWCPYDPHPESVQNVEHMSTELNKLMKEHESSMVKRDDDFNKRKNDLIRGEGDGTALSIEETLKSRLNK
jgi:hypothetical protein